jgi:hypothetical protein
MLKELEQLQMKVATLNNKMWLIIRVLAFIVLVFFYNVMIAQDINSIKKIIYQELILVDKYHEDRVFIDNSSSIDTNSVRINSCRTLDKNYKLNHPEYYMYDIVLVNVTFVNLSPSKKNLGIRFDSLNFEYVLIKKNNIYYKLFGFSTTNINYLRVDFFTEKKFSKFIHWISDILRFNQLITRTEARRLIKSILNNDFYYSNKTNRPINIINKLYPKRLYQTKIIDYEWIKPVLVN